MTSFLYTIARFAKNQLKMLLNIIFFLAQSIDRLLSQNGVSATKITLLLC